MLADAFVPPDLWPAAAPAEAKRAVAAGAVGNAIAAGTAGTVIAAGAAATATASAVGAVPVRTARWTPGDLFRVVEALAQAEEGLAAIPTADLVAAWGATVEAFLDPSSPERRELETPLAERCRLSPPGLAAGLDAVLGGVRRGHAEEVFRFAAERLWQGAGPGAAGRAAAAGAGSPLAASSPSAGRGPVLVVLASNLPALAVQPLLPILAARRPVLLKSPSAEPLFAPAFLAALVRREPRLARAAAAVTWPGGAVELEAPVLAACSRVLAYGGEEAVADLARRAPGKVVAHGPKTSLAVVGEEGLGVKGDDAMAVGLARDIALFDQRGCLSIGAVYVAGPPEKALALGRRLAAELAELARRWPPGPPAASELAAVQQLRLEAEMRGLAAPPLRGPDGARLPLAAGTVVVEPEPAFRPSPGLRTVRVHPIADLKELPSLLAVCRGRLQG